MKQPTNSTILSDEPLKNSFILGDYAAVPCGNMLMIIHQGKQLKLCRSEDSARKFITNHSKGKSVAKLPVDLS